MNETIEIDGHLYHARDGIALTYPNGDLVPAYICLCFAHCASECACGAWDRPLPEGDSDVPA